MLKMSRDGVTALVMLDTRAKRKNGMYPVKVEVCHNRDQRYYHTGQTLSQDEWDLLRETKSRKLILVREFIENSFTVIWNAVSDVLRDGRDFSYTKLDSQLGISETVTVNDIFLKKIKELKENGQTGTMLLYKNTLSAIVAYKGKNVRFDSINQEWLQKFEEKYSKKGMPQKGKKPKGNSVTTIAIHFRNIRAAFNLAINKKLISRDLYPFGKKKYRIKSGRKVKKALTIKQIEQIFYHECNDDKQKKHHDYWLFLYMCNGISVVDFIRLKYSQIVDGEIVFMRKKTANTVNELREIRAIMTPEMEEIIKRWGNPRSPDNYIFPIITEEDDPEVFLKVKNQFLKTMNSITKKIGATLGIGKITSYVARHSYATVLKRAGANIASIYEGLGHSSLTTTQHYLDDFEVEERQKNSAMLLSFKNDQVQEESAQGSTQAAS